MRIPANPSFAFASGGGGDAIVADYCLGMYLVTNNDYRDFIAATGARAPRHWIGGGPPADKGTHPVLWVSLTDAQAYCDWRTSQYPGWTIRLPTEAEWDPFARVSGVRRDSP